MSYSMVKMTTAPSSLWLTEIRPIPRPNVGPDRWVNCTGELTSPRGWLEPLRVIYEHQLVVFRDAAFVVEIGGRRFECPPDSFIVVPPGQRHVSWNADRRSGRRFWSHFDWEPAGNPAERPIMTYHPARLRRALVSWAPPYVPKGVLHGTVESPGWVLDLATRLVARQDSPNPHDRIMGRALLLELLLELLDEGPRQAEARDPNQSLAVQVRSMLERIGSDEGEDRHIREALASTGYSYEYLLRIFRRVFGLTPMQYVIALRLERAKLLLRDTDQAIAKVAARVGIHDAAYFAELFRRHFGIRPSEYRQAGR
jgi:AraC-like DNA-binding protein